MGSGRAARGGISCFYCLLLYREVSWLEFSHTLHSREKFCTVHNMGESSEQSESRKSALLSGGSGVMAALRNSPVSAPPLETQRLDPGSPYPNAVGVTDVAMSAANASSVVVPPRAWH